MRKFFTLLTSLMLLCLGYAHASHVAGGQMTYKYISTTGTAHTYELEFIIYGDCAGIVSSTLVPATAAGIVIFNGASQVQSLNLPKIPGESNILISPVCPSAINQTTCSSGGTLVGIKKFTFRGNITINGESANWRFVSDGTLVGTATTNIRSNLADNVIGASGTTMFLDATLNNVGGPNTTPIFTSDPTPFYCMGIPSSFGLGAVEGEGDGMTYSLTAPLTNLAGTTTIPYQAGYSATNPLNVAPGSFVFSTATGVADFIPASAPWEGIVVSKVTETRNGVVVGTCSREMMFVFLQNCTNTAPSTPVGNVNNGELLPGSTANNVEFRVCEAQQVQFTYEVSVTDPQNDNVEVFATNLPGGATLNVTNNNTPNPSVSIAWDLSTVPAGTYQFYVTFKDDGCPLSSVKVVSYTVYVQAFNGNFSVTHQQPCRDEANGFAIIQPDPTDTALYKYTWMDPAFNILQATPGLQSVGDTLNNLTPGIYLVEAENIRGCKRRFNVIIDSPTYKAYFEVDSIICVNNQVNFNPNYDFGDFTQWHWEFGNGVTSNDSAPVIFYSIAGQYQIKFTGTTDIGCVDSFSQWVTVDSIMRPEFVLDKNSICAGEKITATTDFGNNARKVVWNFGDGGTLTTNTIPSIQYAYPKAGTYNLGMTVSYRSCPDVTYSKTVTVHDLPKVYLGEDNSLCYQGTAIELKNLAGTTNGERYLWNTGETVPVIQANHHGVYSLTVTSNDCSTTDSVYIAKDCYVDIPNAFIPGSGDASGYFLPRSILSKGVSQFDMSIYNRWGERIFFTANPDGRGWDGTMNGKDQPAGVYVYQINVTYKTGKSEKYQGNVTLVR